MTLTPLSEASLGSMNSQLKLRLFKLVNCIGYFGDYERLATLWCLVDIIISSYSYQIYERAVISEQWCIKVSAIPGNFQKASNILFGSWSGYFVNWTEFSWVWFHFTIADNMTKLTCDVAAKVHFLRFHVSFAVL